MVGSALTIKEISSLLEELRATETAMRVAYETRQAALTQQINAAEVVLQLLIEGSPLPASMVNEGISIPYEVVTDEQDHQTTEHRYATPAAIEQASMPRSTTHWSRILDNVTHREALRLIAEKRQGVVKVTEAKKIFLDVGLARGNPKNLAGTLYGMLSDSPDYEWIAPGTYRLIASSGRVPTMLIRGTKG